MLRQQPGDLEHALLKLDALDIQVLPPARMHLLQAIHGPCHLQADELLGEGHPGIGGLPACLQGMQHPQGRQLQRSCRATPVRIMRLIGRRIDLKQTVAEKHKGRT